MKIIIGTFCCSNFNIGMFNTHVYDIYSGNVLV